MTWSKEASTPLSAQETNTLISEITQSIAETDHTRILLYTLFIYVHARALMQQRFDPAVSCIAHNFAQFVEFCSLHNTCTGYVLNREHSCIILIFHKIVPTFFGRVKKKGGGGGRFCFVMIFHITMKLRGLTLRDHWVS